MAVDPLVAPLLGVELFQGLKPLQITEIARNAERMVFRKGEAITEAGKAGDAAFLIVAGAAAWIGTGVGGDAGETVEIGSLIGEMAMLIEYTYGATIVAAGPVRCLKINRETMHRLMLDDRSLAQHFSSKITLRLNRVAKQLRSIDQESGDLPGFMVDVAERPVASELRLN